MKTIVNFYLTISIRYDYIDGLINERESIHQLLEIKDSEVNNIFEINFNLYLGQIYIQKHFNYRNQEELLILVQLVP